MRRLLATAGVLMTALLFADGGALVFRQQSGPLWITVTGAPSPLRTGIADFTVLVQEARDHGAVLDAKVDLILSRAGEKEIRIPATHAQATNKLLYGARPVLPSAGEWRLQVLVASAGRTVAAEGTVAVEPQPRPAGAYWPYIAPAPVGILLFAANQFLKSRSAGGMRRTR